MPSEIKCSAGSSAVSVVFALLFSFSASLYSQSGGVFLTHFSESRQAEDQNWAICQDSYNIMLFANRRGVATYDGYHWNLLMLPVIPYTMVYHESAGRVYIGGENGYGYLSRNENGIYEYTPIEADTAVTGIVSSVVFTGSSIFFLSPQLIVKHAAGDLSVEALIRAGNDESFSGMFALGDDIFVSTWENGLYRLDGETLVPLVTGYMTARDEILFALPFDARRVLIGLGSNSIHLFDGTEFMNWEPDDNGYLQQRLLATGHCVNDTLYIFGTIEGGVVVAGRNNRKVYHIINYDRGLPDDEVYAVGSDNSSGLWISHESGLSRADFSLPVSNFSIYTGLTGNLISTAWYKNRLYVGTSDGLFVLREVRRYDTEQVMRRVSTASRTRQQTGPDSGQGGGTAAGEVQQEERRSIFDRIFGKRVEAAGAGTGGEPGSSGVQGDHGRAESQASYRYVTRTVNRLRSVSHEYRRVEGMPDKCRQLVVTPDGLLAATGRGLYVVADSVAVPVVTGRYINRIGSRGRDGRYYVAANNGYFSVWFSEGRWRVENPFPGISRTFVAVAMDGSGNLWLGSENSVLRLKAGNFSGTGADEYRLKSDIMQRYHVEYMRDTLFVLTATGVSWFDPAADSLMPLDHLPGSARGDQTYILTENSRPWMIVDGTPVFLGNDRDLAGAAGSYLKLFRGVGSITLAGSTLWITDNSNRLFRVEPGSASIDLPRLNLYVGGYNRNEEPFFNLSQTEFARGHNLVRLTLVSPFYISQDAVEYRYNLEGVTGGWTEWSSSPEISMVVKPGNYTLRLMSRAVSGVTSDEREFQFRIRPKLTETRWFYLILVAALLGIVFMLMRMREKKLLHDKMLLEEKVRERTAEIAAQKAEITSSIEYASRIQQAMLPDESVLRDTFGDHLILFRPRDIVSGDFYWVAREGGRVFFTAADCTGHGVPGAFMSMMGISLLNEIINSDTTLSASEVLDTLRERIKKSLKQTGRQGETTDGIDMALCIFDLKAEAIEFAAAFNSMVHFRGSKITEYRGDRMPIGIFYGEKEHFTNHVIRVKKGDTIYLLTDGYADQFGGPDNSKFKMKNLKLLLQSVSTLPMAEQKRILEEQFELWRGNREQIDDITIVGVRI